MLTVNGATTRWLVRGVVLSVVCACGFAGAAPEASPYIGPENKATPAPKVSEKGPLKLSLQNAVLVALMNNRGLRVERLSPAVTRALEGIERAVFDPIVGGTVSYEHIRAQTPAGVNVRTREKAVELFIEEFLPTGTTIRLEDSASQMESTLFAGDFTSARVGVSVTQALLRGMPVSVNLARLRQARLDTRISQYELRGFVEVLVAHVAIDYWNYAVADRQLSILQTSLKLTEQQLSETTQRVRVGRVAESELAAAKAEVALRNEELIDVRSLREKRRLLLLRRVNPRGKALWDRAIDVLTYPKAPEMKLEPAANHVKVALRLRPDLNQARLQVQQGALEVVRTRNGLLPKLDFFVAAGTTGYSSSFGKAFKDVDGDHYDIIVGLTGEFPPLNRAARSEHRGAMLARRQLVRAVSNLEQLAALEVRTAHEEVRRAFRQIGATATTRGLRESSLRAETEKFKVGKSTSFLVAQAQRELLASQLKEVQAIVACLNGLVDLYRADGSLIARSGLSAPGEESVALSAGERR